MHLTKEDVKKIVENSGLITTEEFTAAENESIRSGQAITEILIGRGLISEQILIDSLSEFIKVPFIKLEKVDTLTSEIVEKIPEVYAKNKGVILFAFDEEKKEGSLAMVDPDDFDTINYLRKKLDAWLEVYLTTSSSIKHGLKSYKQKISEDFNKIIEENIQASIETTGKNEGVNITKLSEAVPIIRILDSILEHAASLGASDIHFEPFRDKLLVRYRMDGILQEILSLPKEIAPILIARIKVVANLQIDIHNAPQDGRFRFPVENQFIDARVSIIPTFHGEKGEMRLLKGSLRPLSLAELGLSHKDMARLNEAIKKPHGLILVTGPTGSGKTTTLYAVLEILNTPKVNITTIEDPIEYDIPRVNQTQVSAKAGLTFANGLRTLMRQNPDIIMIGEIRDQETADIAINAALTGHLLLSTLHTNDAPSAVPRLTDLGVQPFLLASTLNVVIAQRLVRKLCPICIGSEELDQAAQKTLEEQAKQIGIEAKELPKVVYKSKGCTACNFTGYKGQLAIFEVLYVSEGIKNLIINNSPTHLIRKKAREEGMQTLFEDGLEKISSGFTSLEEVLRVASE